MATIVVIDDDIHILEMIDQILKRFGHEVHTASDGKIGLQKCRQIPVDLVVTDILMPEKEGIQTIMELRREFPEIKIIAISGGGAVGPDTYLNMARELGADRTLIKPFSMNQLAEILNDLLQGQTTRLLSRSSKSQR